MPAQLASHTSMYKKGSSSQGCLAAGARRSTAPLTRHLTVLATPHWPFWALTSAGSTSTCYRCWGRLSGTACMAVLHGSREAREPVQRLVWQCCAVKAVLQLS